MKIEFKNKHLLRLYTEGNSRKYNLPRTVLEKYFMRVQQLEAAVTIYDLWKTSALNFEALQGFQNRYSVRLEKKWRLEMEIEWEDREKTKGTIFIVELSKHYED